MKIPNFFRQIEKKVSRAYALHFSGPQKVAWTKHNYRSFAHEAYTINVIAMSAIQRIANAVASIEWQVRMPDGSRVDDHPYLDLINRPNPGQSGDDWWRMRMSYLHIAGDNYDELVEGANGKPAELWVLRPDRVTILKGKTGLPAAYEYKVGNEKPIRFEADVVTGESAIRHIRFFNPLDDWYGMSPIAAAAYGVDQHNASMTWVQALLQNSARPSGALTVESDEGGLSEQEYDRLKAEIEHQYSGPANAGRPMLLEGGLKWIPMGFSPEDMEILKTREAAARDISLALGVPPLLLNIPGDNTYSNYREARLGFYEDTILPLLGYQTQELNEWLSPKFGGAKLVPNKDKIEAIADKRVKQWEMADNSDDLTLDESREMKGLPPIGGPRGSMLMVDVRAEAAAKKTPEQEESEETIIKAFGYGVDA